MFPLNWSMLELKADWWEYYASDAVWLLQVFEVLSQWEDSGSLPSQEKQESAELLGQILSQWLHLR